MARTAASDYRRKFIQNSSTPLKFFRNKHLFFVFFYNASSPFLGDFGAMKSISCFGRFFCFMLPQSFIDVYFDLELATRYYPVDINAQMKGGRLFLRNPFLCPFSAKMSSQQKKRICICSFRLESEYAFGRPSRRVSTNSLAVGLPDCLPLCGRFMRSSREIRNSR